jgi:hypothetical protein
MIKCNHDMLFLCDWRGRAPPNSLPLFRSCPHCETPTKNIPSNPPHESTHKLSYMISLSHSSNPLNPYPIRTKNCIIGERGNTKYMTGNWPILHSKNVAYWTFCCWFELISVNSNFSIFKVRPIILWNTRSDNLKISNCRIAV